MTEPPAPASRHWAEIGEAGFVGGMHLLVFIYRWFGRLPFRLALYPVLGYFFVFRGGARRASLDYLRRLQQQFEVFTDPPGVWTAWRHFLSFAEAILDKVLALGGAFPFAEVAVHGRGAVQQLVDSGRGAVLLTAHLGNLEVCRALAELRPNLMLNILVHTRNAENFNRMLARYSGPQRMRLIEVSEITPATAMVLADRVAAGELLVIAADRLTPGSGKRSCAVPFLGSPAEFPLGPFILASLLRCPVFLVYCARRSDGYHLEFQSFAERIDAPRARRESALREYVARYAQSLEQQCRQAPLQWFNFYDFWT